MGLQEARFPKHSYEHANLIIETHIGATLKEPDRTPQRRCRPPGRATSPAARSSAASPRAVQTHLTIRRSDAKNPTSAANTCDTPQVRRHDVASDNMHAGHAQLPYDTSLENSLTSRRLPSLYTYHSRTSTAPYVLHTRSVSRYSQHRIQ